MKKMFLEANFSTKILICLGVFIFIYSQELVVLSLLNKAQPDVLTGALFTTGVVEVIALVKIYIVKPKKQIKDESEEIKL